MMRAALCGLLLVTAACRTEDEPVAGSGAATAAATAAPPPAVPTGDVGVVLERVLAMMQKLGAAAQAHAGDCGALATALDGLVAEYQPVLDELAGYPTDGGTAAQVQSWMASHAGEIDAAIAKVRPALEGCRGDPRVKAAFERLSHMP